jgi:hypothetical protein
MSKLLKEMQSIYDRVKGLEEENKELLSILSCIVDDIEKNHLKTYTRSDYLFKSKQALSKTGQYDK